MQFHWQYIYLICPVISVCTVWHTTIAHLQWFSELDSHEFQFSCFNCESRIYSLLLKMWTLNTWWMKNDLHITETAHSLPGMEAQIFDTNKQIHEVVLSVMYPFLLLCWKIPCQNTKASCMIWQELQFEFHINPSTSS